MDRRDFLRSSGLAAAGLALPASRLLAAEGAEAPWRHFEVTTRIEILKPEGATRAWVPVPLTEDRSWLKAMGNTFEAEGGHSRFALDPRYGAGIVCAEWSAGVKPVLLVKSRFATRDVKVDLSRADNPIPETPETLAKYLAPTAHMQTTGAVKDLSDEVVKGASDDVDKARAIYEWICDNTYRNPKTKGCGTGDVNFMVETKTYNGKCADLNALFTAMARSQGIPARDVYGIRVADSKLGYKSLGKSGDITKAQHCRAEFYSKAHGWVPVDPADVRKVILEEDGGKKPDDPMVLAARKRLFGSWEMNWLGYNYANEVALPGSSHPPVTFLMYPQSETAEGRLDSLDPEHFGYQITSREITA